MISLNHDIWYSSTPEGGGPVVLSCRFMGISSWRFIGDHYVKLRFLKMSQIV